MKRAPFQTAFFYLSLFTLLIFGGAIHAQDLVEPTLSIELNTTVVQEHFRLTNTEEAFIVRHTRTLDGIKPIRRDFEIDRGVSPTQLYHQLEKICLGIECDEEPDFEICARIEYPNGVVCQLTLSTHSSHFRSRLEEDPICYSTIRSLLLGKVKSVSSFDNLVLADEQRSLMRNLKKQVEQMKSTKGQKTEPWGQAKFDRACFVPLSAELER